MVDEDCDNYIMNDNGYINDKDSDDSKHRAFLKTCDI